MLNFSCVVDMWPSYVNLLSEIAVGDDNTGNGDTAVNSINQSICHISLVSSFTVTVFFIAAQQL